MRIEKRWNILVNKLTTHKESLEEVGKQGMEPIADSGNKNSAKGQGKNDINLNEGGIKQNLRRKEKETSMRGWVQETSKGTRNLPNCGIVCSESSKKISIEQNQTKILSHIQTRNQKQLTKKKLHTEKK